MSAFRERIRRVYVRKKRNWMQPVLIGAGIGYAVKGPGRVLVYVAEH